MEIKRGNKIKMVLLASKTLPEVRMSRGITDETFQGEALTDLVVNEPFIVDTHGGELKTSPVQKIQKGCFATMNSTYSIEKLENGQ